eukprot:CCRYP_012837-RE/>CCRYP_012837-RE protein AED:0.30 eAED:0.30 QI:969/0.75/0.8/1/0.5/0.4/5/88/773
MTDAKWMTSGAQRLKANLGRSFGVRKIRKDGRNRKESERTSLSSCVVGVIAHRPKNQRCTYRDQLQCSTMNDGNYGTNGHNNSQADNDGNSRMNAQPNSLAVAGLRMGSLMTLNPLLFQQEMLRRQEIERNLMAISASALRIPCPDAELEILSQRENELIRLRNAHSQMMEAELVARSDDNATAGTGIDDSFRTESIERIVALQEQRRRQAELMIGLPGHQLGQWTFNMLHQHNQSLSLSGLASSGAAPQWPASPFEQGFVFANRSNIEPNGMVHGQGGHIVSVGQGRFNEQPPPNEQRNNEQSAIRNQALIREAALEQNRSQLLSGFNRPNQYSRNLSQQQQHLERLMRLQQLNDDQQMTTPQFHGSNAFATNVLSQFQGGGNVMSNSSSPSANGNAVSTVRVTRGNPPTVNSIQARLRYFNNGTEVDINGNPVLSSAEKNRTPATALPGDTNGDACIGDNGIMSQFVQLVLSRVPEMSHIMTGFLSSLDMRRRAGAGGALRQDVLSVIDMALTELTSIDEHVLQSIDPKCSDFASRVVQCIYAIEAFKNRFLRPTPASDSLVSYIDQGEKDMRECSNEKKNDQKDDDLTLMQMYKRSKKSKNAKKVAKKAAESSRKRSHNKISTSKPSEVDKEATNKQDQSELKTKSPPCLDASPPPKKQKLKEHCSSSSSSKTTEGSLPIECSKGPHGDLLGKLFSSDEPLSTDCAPRKVVTETPMNAEEPPNSSNGPLSTETALELSTETVNTEESSSAAGETDDSKMSAASVLLDLRR